MRAAVCDDEEVYRDIVKQKLVSYSKAHNIDFTVICYKSGRELLDSGENFEIVFMDIELEEENGLDIIREYQMRHEALAIVFTSHNEEIENGYIVRAFRFLMKPIDEFKFQEALNSAVDEINSYKKLEVYDSDNLVHVVNTREIIYIEAGNKMTGVKTEGDFYTTHLSMKQMMEILDGNFYSPHRSYIVNLNYISTFGKDEIKLSDDSRIKISRLKYHEFKQVFFGHIRRNTYGH